MYIKLKTQGFECIMSNDNKEAIDKLPDSVEYKETNEKVCENKDSNCDKC